MRPEKRLLLEEIKEKIEGAQSLIVTKYQGISATGMRTFRDKLSELEGDFEVVRKRVFLKAASEAGLSIKEEDLDGHVGVVFSKQDLLAIAKMLVKYEEENENAIKILAGLFDGEVCSGEDVEALAKLPSRDQLRAMIVGLLAMPMSQVVGTVNAVLTSVPYCLDAKEKKEQGENP